MGQLTEIPKELSLVSWMAEQLAVQMDSMMDVSSEKRTETSLAQLTAMPTETRLVLPKETNLALPKEMPKDKSLACLSDGQMAMQTGLMLEICWA